MHPNQRDLVVRHGEASLSSLVQAEFQLVPLRAAAAGKLVRFPVLGQMTAFKVEVSSFVFLQKLLDFSCRRWLCEEQLLENASDKGGTAILAHNLASVAVSKVAVASPQWSRMTLSHSPRAYQRLSPLSDTQVA